MKQSQTGFAKILSSFAKNILSFLITTLLFCVVLLQKRNEAGRERQQKQSIAVRLMSLPIVEVWNTLLRRNMKRVDTVGAE